MRYMLDTNTCIHIIKHHPPEVKRRLRKIPIGEVAVSSIVVAELCYGVAQSQKRKHNQEALDHFLEYLLVLDWPAEAALPYGEVRTHLEKKGTPIGAIDLLIAVHAVTENAILVTDNITEFRRVPKLKVENWLNE